MNDENAYFSYLVRKIFYRSEYSRLLKYLFSTPYINNFDEDDSRINNALSKRRLSNFNEYAPPFQESSVFELLVELAMEIENTLYDPKYGYRGSQWFWEFIVNMGLIDMTDGNFDEKKVRDIIDKFCTKTYRKNGSGSPFITRNKKIDMRTLSIWDQMQVFMIELCH